MKKKVYIKKPHQCENPQWLQKGEGPLKSFDFFAISINQIILKPDKIFSFYQSKVFFSFFSQNCRQICLRNILVVTQLPRRYVFLREKRWWISVSWKECNLWFYSEALLPSWFMLILGHFNFAIKYYQKTYTIFYRSLGIINVSQGFAFTVWKYTKQLIQKNQTLFFVLSKVLC